MQAAYEAKTEGPSFALKQAYEQLKEKLRNESELRQKLCVELDRFKVCITFLIVSQFLLLPIGEMKVHVAFLTYV